METLKNPYRPRVFISLFFCVLMVFWDFKVSGEEWTAEQKEVWDAVKADAELIKQRDVEGVAVLTHNDAIMWFPKEGVPFEDKNMYMGYIKWWLSWDRPTKWEVKPLAIQVVGNVANVFYILNYSRDNAVGGKYYVPFSSKERTMETWVKQDNKWLKIGRFSASCDKLPPCR